MPNPFVPAAARARGLTLRATDTEWIHDDGARTVCVDRVALPSVLAGRWRALDLLSGDGVEVLRTGSQRPSNVLEGKFRSSTLCACAAPVTGSDDSSKRPICTSSDAWSQ